MVPLAIPGEAIRFNDHAMRAGAETLLENEFQISYKANSYHFCLTPYRNHLVLVFAPVDPQSLHRVRERGDEAYRLSKEGEGLV